MRWQQLFADLQAQFDEQEAAADRAEWGSRARAEIGSVTLAARLAHPHRSPNHGRQPASTRRRE